MKTNYVNKFSEHFRLLALTGLLISFTFSVTAQTSVTVFTEDFNREATAQPLSNGGVPEMEWTTVTTVSPVTTTGARTEAALLVGAVDDYALRIYPSNSTDGQAAGRTYVYGELSRYSAPFAAKLSDNAHEVTWSFSFRTNRNTAFSGFDAQQYGMAVVLVADGSDFLTANGYAVVLNRNANTVNNVSLVKFASGLSANANITTLIGPSSRATTDHRVWFNVKVVYTPATDSWKLYVHDQPTGSTDDKGDATAVTTQVGDAAVDATYTGAAMTHFGVLFNHSGVSSANVNSNTVYIDDLKVSVLDVSTTTPAFSAEGVSLLSENNRVKIIGAKQLTCSVYNVAGQLVVARQIADDQEEITLPTGLYVVSVGNERFKVLVK